MTFEGPCGKIIFVRSVTRTSADQAVSPASEKIASSKKEMIRYADMAELADAYGSGPYASNCMQVQVLLSAPQNALQPGRFVLHSVKK